MGESNKKYDSWNDCMKDALTISIQIMEELPEENINKLKLATKYFCYEKEKIKA